MKNYRKLYSDKYRIVIHKDLDIHHIDCNRENNDIDNLILLPKKLHQDYHTYFRVVESASLNWSCSDYSIEVLRNFCNVMEIIQEWKTYKMLLDNEQFAAVAQFEQKHKIRRN